MYNFINDKLEAEGKIQKILEKLSKKYPHYFLNIESLQYDYSALNDDFAIIIKATLKEQYKTNKNIEDYKQIKVQL